MRAGDTVDGRFELIDDLAPASPHRQVWHAYDRELRRHVVLKDVRGASEPRAMAGLRHRHVIAVYEPHPIRGDRPDAGDWIVLEYAPGGSLAGRRWSPADAAKIGAQIADALIYVHGRGMTHCDIKPGNIVLTEDGAAKLTDFGSAVRSDPTSTPQPGNAYTLGYAAREHIEGIRSPATDIHALAATVYAMVMGAPPAAGGFVPDARLGLLNQVLPDMLDPDPAARPDATRSQRNLQAIAEGRLPEALPVGAEPTVPPPPPPPHGPRPGPGATPPEPAAGRRARKIGLISITAGGTLLLIIGLLVATPLGQSIGLALPATDKPAPIRTVTAAAPTPTSPTPSASRTKKPRPSDDPSEEAVQAPSPTAHAHPSSSRTTSKPKTKSCQKRELYRATEDGKIVYHEPDDSDRMFDTGDTFVRTSFATPPDDLDDRYYGTVTSGDESGETGYVLARKFEFVRSMCA